MDKYRHAVYRTNYFMSKSLLITDQQTRKKNAECANVLPGC